MSADNRLQWSNQAQTSRKISVADEIPSQHIPTGIFRAEIVNSNRQNMILQIESFQFQRVKADLLISKRRALAKYSSESVHTKLKRKTP